MLTFFQIAIILLLMALVGMLVGYLFGQFSCKRVSKDTMIKKGGYCEGEYAQKHNLNAQTDHSELEQLKDTFEQSSSEDELKSVATPLMRKEEDTHKEDSSKVEDEKESSELVEEDEAKKSVEVENRSDAQELLADEQLESEDSKKEDSDKKETNEADKEDSQSKEGIKENTQLQDNSNEQEVKLSEDSDKKEQTSNEDMAQEDSESLAEKEIENIDSTIDMQEEGSKETAQNDYTPQFLSEPKDGKEDNLCEIKGIGKVIDEKLKNLGVFHFEQIAQWTQKDIAWIDEHLAFKGRVEREDWIGQAKLLAEGKETEFSKRVKKGEVASSKKD